MLTMRRLLLGIVFIIFIGFGGFFYRNAIEYKDRQINCPIERLVCPDGTELSPVPLSCAFAACPPPNVTLDDLGLTFVLPSGFGAVGATEEIVARYEAPGQSALEPKSVEIRKYPLTASTTPLAIIQETAIGGASGLPVSPAQFSSVTLGGRTFTVVPIERFEAVVQVAYYLTRPGDVLRFDATDRGVVDWMEPSLDVTALPAQQGLRGMLSTLQSR